MTIDELTSQIMQLAKTKGFGTKPQEIDVYEKLALIHSEVSEALFSYRKSDDEHFKSNLADVVIRTVHLAGIFGFDVEKMINEKLEINESRERNWQKLKTNTKVKE